MKIVYSSEKTEKACTDKKAAKKVFGGNNQLAVSLFACINAIDQAVTLIDIIRTPIFHFHSLKNKKGNDLKGYYAIDLKGRKEPWRLILQPLDENEEPYPETETIDRIAGTVRIVEITEVSKHYE